MSLLQKKDCRIFLILILIVFYFKFVKFVDALIINEINYNPINQTYYDEYVELYSETFVNLSDFVLCDLEDCDGLVLYKNLNSSYYLITTNQSNYKECNCSIYFVNDSRLGNGLNNDGDCIFLFSSSINLSFCYNESIEKGYSLQLINGSWKKCFLTPCTKNYCEEEENFYVEFPKIIFNKNKEFPVLISSKNNSVLYDVKIDVLANETRLSKIYDENEGKWKSTYYYVKSVNLSNKTFVLKIDSNFSGDATLEIKIKNFSTYVYPISILDFFIKETQNQTNQTQQQEESYLSIVDYKVDKDFIKAKVKVYRGDTRKYAIYAYVLDKEKEKKISEDTVFYALDKFKEYNLVLPIKIKNVEKSKNYFLILEGLGLLEKKEIFLEKNFEQENISCKFYKEISEGEQTKEIDFGNFSLSYVIKSFDNKFYLVEGSLKNRGKKGRFYLWSYVGNCLSCEKSKEENVLSFFLNQNQSANFSLKNKVLSDAYGFYDLIINVLKEGEEIKEIRENVFVDNRISEVKAKEYNIDETMKCFDEKEKNNKEKNNYFIFIPLIFLFLLFVLSFYLFKKIKKKKIKSKRL